MFRPLLVLLALTAPAHAADCPRPANLRFELTGKIVRSEVGFTQGLEWRDGKLYESTGAIGDHSGKTSISDLVLLDTRQLGYASTSQDFGTYDLSHWLEIINPDEQRHVSLHTVSKLTSIKMPRWCYPTGLVSLGVCHNLDAQN